MCLTPTGDGDGADVAGTVRARAAPAGDAGTGELKRRAAGGSGETRADRWSSASRERGTARQQPPLASTLSTPPTTTTRSHIRTWSSWRQHPIVFPSPRPSSKPASRWRTRRQLLQTEQPRAQTRAIPLRALIAANVRCPGWATALVVVVVQNIHHGDDAGGDPWRSLASPCL